MPLTPPTVEKMVYNRVVFLPDDIPTKNLIMDFQAEVYAELQKVLDKADADYLDETKYSLQENSLVADMVGINFIKRRVLTNSEGIAGADATGNRLLKKGKAGEAEVEFSNPKASDGSKLLQTANDVLATLMNDAMRKARTLGFFLDISKESEFVVNAYSNPTPQFRVISFD